MAQSLITHRIRFCIYEPTSINCLSYNERLSKIALLRRPIRKYNPQQNDMPSHIEIWNLQNKAPFLEQTIYDDPDQPNLLESIAWSSSGRLFSCGLSSNLNEYDLKTGQIFKSYSVNSDPTWCMSIDPNEELIAVGTEKGYVCVFQILKNTLQFEKSISKCENRVLCVEWYRPEILDQQDILFIVAGSIEFIKIFNYHLGRCIDFIKVGNDNTIVWCLKVLKDFTIVSGDSNGTTSFWNGKTITLIQSYNMHRGDVLSICVSPDEQSVFVAGVDPSIIEYNRTESKDGWLLSWKRRPHTHDVRSLAINNKWIISGGVDSYLTLTTYKKPKLNNPYTHFNHLSNLSRKIRIASTDPDNNYICFMYEKFIQIWKLGQTDQTPCEGYVHDHTNNTKSYVTKLNLLDCATKLMDTKSRKPILAFDFNSKWLIYANYTNMKVLQWSEDNIEKVKILHDPIANINEIKIIDQNRFVVSYGKNFQIFKLDPFGVSVDYTGVSNNEKRIYKILSSKTRLIIITDDENVSIYDLQQQQPSNLTTFPIRMLPCASYVSSSNENIMMLAFADYSIIKYDLESLKIIHLIDLSTFKSNEKNQEFKTFKQNWHIRQIVDLSSSNKESFLFSDDNNLYLVKLKEKTITKCDQYRNVIFMDLLNNNGNDQNQLALVEMTKQMIMTTLPPLLKTKSFGT